ncbi:diacylglycerol kinase theta-like [Dendronephthya gigantea]|uniref:diacylglycerol kinase theta-like n=1 Tax=Dendronephthya gigantea TaxID=151771 RepID=UPI001068ECA0|nr:diacylglycerol kinase theta-like [Dendronephthya gigantea]
MSRKSLSKTGRSKSAAFLEALGNNGHSFSKKTYHRPTYCHHCTDLLWGFTNQGLQCSVCNFVSHEKCLFLITMPCNYLANTDIKHPVAHSWCPLTSLRRKFCNVCRKLLNDSSDYSCEVCEYYVHKSCKDSAVNNCKRNATYNLKQTKGENKHHWQEGNLPSGSKCFLCKKSCSSSECLASVRCKWCSKTAHSGCYVEINKHCDFGKFSHLILPPYAVSLANIALWRRMSSEHCKNFGKTHNPNDCSGDILLSEHIDSDDESLVDSPSDSVHSSDATNSIKVYDGKIDSPRMFKVVHASRTSKASQVLEEALRLYQITDDPDNYYLIKTLDQFSERALDSDEMPLQFPHRNKEAMIFLRIKNADKSGNIRVYLAMDREGSSFKTFKVQSTTTVEEVVKNAITKFSLENKNPEDFSLIITHLYDGVNERVMEEDECPWKILTEMKRRSIREMKFTRFYLRPAYEPSSSVVLCVSNLPMMLRPDTYPSFLKEHLQHGDFTIEALYPSSGTAFLSFTSTDMASRAMNELQTATLSGKSLFVKLLPDIHVDALGDKSKPLLVLVNVRSGGGQGNELLFDFQKLLNPHQVYSLSEGGPLPGLYAFRHLESFRIVACGGDGTVGWVLSSLDECCKDLKCRDPPVSIVPLGTGNDLSRVLRWGAGYTGNEDTSSILMTIDQADITCLDRWLIIFESSDTSEEPSTSGEDLPNSFVMNNYFGIGCDAAVSLDFHLAREESPEKFTSRLHNKSVYFRVGLRNMVRKSLDFNDNVSLQIDDNDVDLPTIEGIILLNIPSWAGGCDIWGQHNDDKFSTSSPCDNLLEVIGITGVMHMGQIKSGIRSGIRLGQGSKINLKLKSEFPVHVDGEPWFQPPGNIVIRPTLRQAKMLQRHSKSRSIKTNEPGKALVSSTFYSFDESGNLEDSFREKHDSL